jgi:hypothetical protein
MSVLEKISNELISLAYMDKDERVVRFAELESETNKLFQELPREEAEIIDQIIKGLFEEAKEDAKAIPTAAVVEKTNIGQNPESIEVVQPEVVQVPEAKIDTIDTIDLEEVAPKKTKKTGKTVKKKNVEQKEEEEDLSFLDNIEDAF